MAAQELIDAVEDNVSKSNHFYKTIEEMQNAYKHLGSTVSLLEIAIYDVKNAAQQEFRGVMSDGFTTEDIINFNEDGRMYIPVMILKEDDGKFHKPQRVMITVELEKEK